MKRYLITVALGPVQGLIDTARRTRDLWCGSWLLSECARAAAQTLHEARAGCLIFPCPDDPETDLRPRSAPGDEANVANILRAEVELPDGDAARALCERAKAAARARLIALGDQARSGLDGVLRDDVWDAQIGDVLEAVAAWAEVPAGDAGYREASDRLGRTLAARKATRDFTPAASLMTPGLPKSSLDGAMETVLSERWEGRETLRRRLGLSQGEQLDALGVTKRLAGKVDQFTAYSRIAADPWIRSLDADQRDALRLAYEPLVPALATRVSGNDGIYAELPFDGQLLYESRVQAAKGARGKDALADSQRDALRALESVLRVLQKRCGAPVPYAAILKADGDRMGALLRCAASAEESRAISKALHGFASRVRGIVRAHDGHAIYAGGDDVLALLPLPRAEACARALAEDFGASLGPVASRLGLDAAELPTLSAGIGIGHLMEPLGRLRARAARAEHLAKGDAEGDKSRNALAMILGVRGGADLEWRTRWDDTDAFDALHGFIDAYRAGKLPSRVAYDLRAIARRLAWLGETDVGAGRATADGIVKSEVARTLDRARAEAGAESLSGPIRKLIIQRLRSDTLDRVADTLILARWLSARTAADLGERGQ